MLPHTDIVVDAMVKAESRGGSLLHLPTNQDPIWTCHREHKWSATYQQILNGVWCEECEESLGEMAVRTYLDTRKIDYKCEVTFPSLCVNGQLRFDFFLPKYRLVIEADGEQHFGKSKFKVKLLNTLERDEFKDKWCEENNFSMLRIPYWRLEYSEALIDVALQRTEKERIYMFDHRKWRLKAIKCLRNKKKTPKSPAPKNVREITKGARDERRKQREEEKESIKMKLDMPEFSLR